MTYEQEVNGTRGLIYRRLKEVDDKINELEPMFKDLKEERRALRVAIGEKPGPSRQRRPKAVQTELSAAE